MIQRALESGIAPRSGPQGAIESGPLAANAERRGPPDELMSMRGHEGLGETNVCLSF